MRLVTSFFAGLLAAWALIGGTRVAMAAPLSPAAHSVKAQAVSVAVVVSPAPEVSMAYYVWPQRWGPLIGALAAQSGVPLTMRWSAGQTDIITGINAQRYPLVLGPVTTTAQAIKSGYVPLAATSGRHGAVLVTLASSPIKSMADLTAATAKRYRLAMLRAPSFAEFGGRGLLQKAGIGLGDFQAVHTYSNNGEAMMALILGGADVAAVDRAEFENLSRPGKLPLPGSFRVLASFQENGPDVGLAALPQLGAEDKTRLVAALENPGSDLAAALSALNLQGFRPVTAKDYSGMLDLAFTVPRVLPGATVVDAAAVRAALQSGSATLIDARSVAEYLQGHIPGAISVPYAEVSGPIISFDAAKDGFDFVKRFPDKSAQYIFACNGIECWKSYKAAVWALKHGYQHVLWFRGGYPAWKAAGYPVQTGPDPGRL